MKKFALGFIAGALLFGCAANVFAAGGKVIEIFDLVKDIKINQVSRMPDNPDQKPFVYNGTTYVPLRYISENLGYPVKWDGNTQTIYIGETGEEQAVYPGNGIESMNYQSDYSGNSFKYYYNKTIKDNVGNEYENYMVSFINGITNADYRWNLIEFPLNGTYKSFKAKIGLTESYKDMKDAMTVQILLDDKVVYEESFKAGDFPKDVEVNVTNALKFQIKVSATVDRGDPAEIGFFNARFIK